MVSDHPLPPFEVCRGRFETRPTVYSRTTFTSKSASRYPSAQILKLSRLLNGKPMELSTDPLKENVSSLIGPLLTFAFSLGLLITGALVVGAIVTSLQANIVQQVIIIMASMGILGTVTAYGIFRSGVLMYLTSLRWLLLLLVLFTVGVVMLNMWILSRLVFFDTHYIGLVATMLSFSGLTALSFGWFVSRGMTERLFRLAGAANKLAEGDLSTRLDVRGSDEIAQLAQTFNDMAQRLEQVDEQKRQLDQTRRDLVAWVSHDLRTPLTSMRVMLEALSDGIITDPETQTRYTKNTLAEIEHLSRLIDDLFEMAKLDVGHVELHYQQVALADLISDTLGGFMAKAQRKHIDIRGDIDPQVDLVMIAPDKIQRVLKNLIDNAIKYTPADERITIRVFRSDADGVQVDVHNTGIVIPAEVLPNLFDSFYRGESSRATGEDGQRGTGLGLAIARGFVQAHGGRIWASSDETSGTTFSFTLPDRNPD